MEEKEKKEKIEKFFNERHPHKEGIALLRKLALQTAVEEDLKWGVPYYTHKGKNVFAIIKFKNDFGIWFPQGALLKDSEKRFENVPDGKTKGLRSWKFNGLEEVDEKTVLAYMHETLDNQKKGLKLPVEKKGEITIPEQLKARLDARESLKTGFEDLPPYKQREYCEYIAQAKQEGTKLRRLEKILPLIEKGLGLNDSYR